MSDILGRIERKAQKEHMCYMCGTAIKPGESYIHVTIVDSRRVYTNDLHIHCEMLAERYCMAMGCDEYDPGEVRDWARDEICTECEQKACKRNALVCPIVLECLLPPTMLSHADVRRHLEGGGES